MSGDAVGPAAVGFVQIIEYHTSRFDEVDRLGNEWEAAAGPDTTARRRILFRDRDQPGRYLNVVFFDSYEDAMRNSDLPVTQEFAEKMAALVDRPPTFLNLDLLEDIEL